MKHHISVGLTGEKIARAYLEKKKYTILAHNWRYSRAEIDIIARHKRWIVFCEVKTRSNTFYGAPEIFVSMKKKKLMLDAGINYMNEIGYTGEFRFDIISIVLKNDHDYRLKHFCDAFFPGFEGFK